MSSLNCFPHVLGFCKGNCTSCAVLQCSHLTFPVSRETEKRTSTCKTPLNYKRCPKHDRGSGTQLFPVLGPEHHHGGGAELTPVLSHTNPVQLLGIWVLFGSCSPPELVSLELAETLPSGGTGGMSHTVARHVRCALAGHSQARLHQRRISAALRQGDPAV